MPLKYQRRLLGHLTHDTYEPADAPTLAADLGIEDAEREEFDAALRELASRKVIVFDDRGRVRLPPMPDEIVGTFKKHAKGFGFVKPEFPYREGDLFVPAPNTGAALSGDRVRVAVERTMRRGEADRIGHILEVLERKQTVFTGELARRGGQWLVFPDGKIITEPIVVRDPGAKNAKEGDKVAVEIMIHPEGRELAEGVITRVLGEAGRPDVETQATIAAYGLPGEFPESCVEQARRAAGSFDEEVARGEREGFKGRLDLRDTFILTIDPPDARDYDDAIHIIPQPGGGWELGIHIADVSHFIHRGSPLDQEALDRGNSVYLPRHVIPMLPEILSNGICSLQEQVTRFCKSAIIRYDKKGKVVGEGVAATVIRSAKRLTYLEAQALIDGNPELARRHARTEPNYTPELLEALREMNACSRAILERRRAAGMIHLELPEVELIYDDDGHVVDAVPEDNAYTHRLIEMFMVEANEVLARLFEGLGVPLLRRIHPEPTPGDVAELQTAARVAGFRIPKRPTREELQALLDATAGTGAARAVHMAVLRTLTRAEYSPALVGHFALASGAYAHFTSPIRRYADLTVHRSLTEYLRRTNNGSDRPRDDAGRKRLGNDLKRSDECPDFDDLVKIGRQCVAMEERAEEAERHLRSFLVLQLLSEHLGEEFDGIVTGVGNAGVFIQLSKYLADGMIKSEDLPSGKGQVGGRWVVDQRTGGLVHAGSGRSFNIGDKVTVRIAQIDLPARKMDLVVADAASREVGKNKKLSPKQMDQAGLGGGGLNIDWETLKGVGRTGADRRAAKSRQRDQSKRDFRKDRKDKGKQ